MIIKLKQPDNLLEIVKAMKKVKSELNNGLVNVWFFPSLNSIVVLNKN